jgi:hypothetical protein
MNSMNLGHHVTIFLLEHLNLSQYLITKAYTNYFQDHIPQVSRPTDAGQSGTPAFLRSGPPQGTRGLGLTFLFIFPAISKVQKC